MNILQSIFNDHFEEIEYLLHPRDVEMENISKMINCGDPSYGGAMYSCPHCGNMKFSPSFICVLHTFGRPVIALKRIDSYDGENVTFHYNRHEDNAYIQKTLSALDFIKLLIQHIPEKHFKMTRYYVLYARNREKDKSLNKAVHRSKHRLFRSFTKWRNDILLSFGYDPLKCSKCNHEMMFVELNHNHHKVPLDELYERTMKKYKCCSA